MARTAHGSIGERQPLEVRSDHTLAPQTLTVTLRSGQILDPTGGDLVLKLYRAEGDTVPLIDPAFDAPVQLSNDADGRPRFLISQSRALLAAALAALSPPVTAREKLLRQLWWTCSWQDSQGQKFPLYYGEFVVYLGAAGE